MRFITAFFLLLLFSGPLKAEEEFVIDTKHNTVGKINGDPNFTEDNLTDEAYKPLPQKVELISIGEGMCNWALTLYPETSKELHIFWKSNQQEVECGLPVAEEDMPGTFRWPSLVKINRDDSVWKTSEGIHVGMSLDELVTANGGKLYFNGFDWDYGGRCCYHSTKIPQALSLNLLYNPDALSQPEVANYFNEHLVGDKEISSDIPDSIRKKLDIRVRSIQFSFPEKQEEKTQ